MTTLSRKLTFALNAHGPTFERYALLCISSIRYWCHDRVRIRIYQPDNLPPCSPAALAFFARHQVDIIEFHNPWLPDHLEDLRKVPDRRLTYNKLFTLLDVEPDEQRVFLDADQVLLEDPSPVLLSQVTPAGLVATDTPEWFVGDWDQMYRDVGLLPTTKRISLWETYSYGSCPEPQLIQSYPCFCSGLVSVLPNSSLPLAWLELAQMLELNIHNLVRTFFVDQVSLSLAAEATGQEWSLFPRNCSVTPQTFRFIDSPLFFHYCNFDALSAQAARTPSLYSHLDKITLNLKEEVGLDLRFQLLTQWPRWWRRTTDILNNRLQMIGFGAETPTRH